MKKTVLLALLLVAFLSCNDDDNNIACVNEVLPTTSLEAEYGCVDTESQMDINLTGDFEIISTQEEFDAVVEGSCIPEIDFDTYDLVIGKHKLTSGYDDIRYELVEDCETKDLTLYLNFILNITSVSPNVTYHALVPKIDSNIDFDVVFLETGK